MSQTQTTLAQKLLKVQRTIAAVAKNSDNPYFHSKYTSLNEVLRVAKEALLPEGLFLVQGPGINEHGRYIESSIIDSETGQQINCRVPFSGNEKNMQEVGAATTYGRRIGVKSLLAMEDIDDDGETAVGRGQTVRKDNQKSDNTNQPVKAAGVAGVSKQPQTAVPKTPSRKTILEKITQTSKVIVDSKRATQDEVVGLLAGFKVKDKNELTDTQASELLTKLEEILNER